MALMQEVTEPISARRPVEQPTPVQPTSQDNATARLQPMLSADPEPEATLPEPEAQPPSPAPPMIQAEAEAPQVRPQRSTPNWVGLPAADRTPLRFVWQTDASGRFVHLSRELMDAVGAANSMVMGITWDAAVSRFKIQEAAGVAERLSRQQTWTAPPVLWPVAGADVLAPVEMAGLPVTENGHFAGFRGYGIVRIEKATTEGASAAQALLKDEEQLSEAPEERFGPAVKRFLDQEATTNAVSGDKPEASALPVLPQKPEQEEHLRSTGDPVFAGSGDVMRPSDSAVDPPAAKEAVSETNAPHGDRSTAAAAGPSLLTNVERETFREIARSLAAMTGRDQETSTNIASDQTAAARRGIRPLELLKQDLMSRTGVQAASTAEEPVRQTGSDAPVPSPVVPFVELQARRNQRTRPDATPNIPLSLLDRIPVGLLIMQQGRPTFANRAFLDMAGYPDLESFIGEGGVDRLFDVRPAEHGHEISQMTIVTRSGERVPVDATIQATTIDDSAATLTYVRKRQDGQNARYKALELDLLVARSELGELRSVLDTATDGVILLDGNGRILSLNRSAEALFGFDQNEIAGENLTVLLEPDSHIAALDYLEGLKSNGVHSIMNDGRDVKGRERNGGTIPLSMTIGRIGDSTDRQKFCAVLRDITHWKKVEADLIDAKRAAEDSNANKTDFLAKISHEIRTPLNAVIGFSQVMMNEDFGPIGNDRYKQYARDINASGAHIVSLVNDLLDLSKVASGRLDLNFASVDVNALVAACVGMIQPQANAGRVIVRSQLASRMPPVVADERSVRQILINLLSNAAKFTEAGGQVVASTTLTERGEVIIRVRDTGIGMAPEDVRRALEPFRQIPGPRASGGTGLGLPLTKALVEANRAGFTIDSEPGRGTLVEVTFPATRVLAE
jgi:PAS domain S-box-containing protein